MPRKNANAKAQTAQAPKRGASTRKAAGVRKAAVKRAPRVTVDGSDHPSYQPDLPAGFTQNTNPRQNQTY